MFLAINYLYVGTVKLQRRKVLFIAFVGEANFYSLLIWIGFKRHFPLENPLTYFCKVRVKLKVWIVLNFWIINYLWKQRCVCMFFLGPNRCHIWSLSDCNEAGTHNHLVRKRILMCHLEKSYTLRLIRLVDH